MTKLIRWLRGSSPYGEFLAAILFISARYTIWPLFLWVRNECVFFGTGQILPWCIYIPLFAIFVWLIMFLSNEYKQYVGMSTDAFLAGAIFAAAANLLYLWDNLFRSNKELRNSVWIVVLAAVALVYRNFISRSSKNVGSVKSPIAPAAEGQPD